MKAFRQNQIRYQLNPLTKSRAFHFVLAISLFASGFTSHAVQAKYKPKLEKLIPKLDKLPPPLLLKTGIDTRIEIPANVNDFGYAQSSNSFPSKVTFVDPASNAWKNGLQPDDKLISVSFDTTGANLVVERKGKKYACHIEPTGIIKPHTQGNTLSAAISVKETADTTNEAARTLLKHEIVLLIDSSASMNTNDCPDGKTRWSWCQAQAGNLLNENSLKGKVSISVFGTNYSAHSHCQISDLSLVFKNNSASGETNMSSPIKDALASLSSQFYARRPAVIAIITDGRPTDVDKVRKVLIDAANSLQEPGLLTIAFIEIGTPEKYLKEFDTELVKQGAKADIVTLYPFSEVNSQGLLKILARAVQEPKVAATPVKLTAEEQKKQEALFKLNASLKAEAEKKTKMEAQSKVLREAANQNYTFPTPDSVSINKAPPKTGTGIITPKSQELKAHPSGTLRNVPVNEINEKESVLKEGANKIYSFPNSGRSK